MVLRRIFDGSSKDFRGFCLFSAIRWSWPPLLPAAFVEHPATGIRAAGAPPEIHQTVATAIIVRFSPATQ
jgi:hypothetical protein